MVDVELPGFSAISVDRKEVHYKNLANENSAATTPFSSTTPRLESFRKSERNILI